MVSLRAVHGEQSVPGWMRTCRSAPHLEDPGGRARL